MITYKELLGQNSIVDVPLTHRINLDDLLKRVNIFRAAYGKPMTVTSGYRSEQKHRDVYAKKGLKPPMGSKHLIGCAVDFADPDGSLYAFCVANPELLENAELYYEIGTKGWLHLQSKPFGSYRPGGTRGFRP